MFATGVLVCCSAGGTLQAQVCTGDCRGQGRVEISDLILAVRIVLGIASLDDCPALGAAPVGISNLIASVNNALCACRPCATAPPTDTAAISPTATEPPMPTPSPSPEVVVSRWREDMFELTSSTCSQELNQQIREQFAGVMFTYTLRVRGAEVELEDESDGEIVAATLEADGTLRRTGSAQERQGSCVVTDMFVHTVNIGSSPATSMHVDQLSTMGCPTMFECTVQISTRWTRLDMGTAAAVGTGVSWRRALLRAVSP